MNCGWFLIPFILTVAAGCGSGRLSSSDCSSAGRCSSAQAVSGRTVKLSWNQPDFAANGAVLYRLPATGPLSGAGLTADSTASAKLFEIRSSMTGIRISGDNVSIVLDAEEIPNIKTGDCFELRAVSSAGELSLPSARSCL